MESMDTVKRFSAADYVVFGILLLVSLLIGVFFAFRNKKDSSPSNYFLGNRKLHAVPAGLSFVVTYQSSILILGFPAEGYAYGMQYAMQCIGVIVGYLIAAVIAVPIFHPLKISSVYEYYKLRYGQNSVRYIAVTMGIIHYAFYMGIVIYGTALALESVAGLPTLASILIFSSISVIYTSIGGFKAVIWADVFQSVVMFTGILAVLIKSTIDAGGIRNAFYLSRNRINIFDFNPDPTVRHTFWTLVIGSPIQFFHLAITQAGIQRINSTPTQDSARKLFYVAAPVYTMMWILVLLQGMTIFAYYTNKGCDPLASGQITNLNQIIPFTMLELFKSYPGLPGLFIAALSAASLSTMSSGLNSLSAIAYEDFIKVFFKNLNGQTSSNISKAVVVVFGFIAVGFAFLLSNVEGPLGQVMTSFMSAIAGPEVGLFLLSAFYPRARPKAAIIATLISISFVLWLGISQNFLATIRQTPYLPLGPTDQCPAAYNLNTTHTVSNLTDQVRINTTLIQTSLSSPSDDRSALQTFYSISYMYFTPIGCILVLCIGGAISFFTQPETPEVLQENVTLPLSVLVPSCIKKRYSHINGSYSTAETEMT